MNADQITGEGYSLTKTGGVYCFRGSIRLSGQDEYEPLMALLCRAIAEQEASVLLDLRELQFLNSAGLYMLSQFVVRVRDAARAELAIVAAKGVFWQTKSLKNMPRLMPALRLTFE